MDKWMGGIRWDMYITVYTVHWIILFVPKLPEMHVYQASIVVV